MTPATVGLFTFSPTGGTRRVAAQVALGLGLGLPATVHFDLTLPGAAEWRDAACDLAVIGAPVYAGRLPPVLAERLRRIEGGGRPAVLVVVYGNRAFEDALLELANLAMEVGFQPLAAAAFIGEHSYSTPAQPIAPGRPDPADLAKARGFGEQVAARMRQGAVGGVGAPLALPGNFPGKELRVPLGVAPALDAARCVVCGACAAVCPTGAIGAISPVADGDLCIQCCACVKACPEAARRTVDPRVLQIAERLYQTCGMRREPETFFPA